MNNNVFFHKMKMTNKKQEKIIIDYILGINKDEPDEETKQKAKTFYFATCLLLPKESFIKIVNDCGGIDVVLENIELQRYIAKVFKVNLNLVNLRVCELAIQESKRDELEKAYTKLSKAINELYNSGVSIEDIWEHTSQTYEEISRKDRQRKLVNKTEENN